MESLFEFSVGADSQLGKDGQPIAMNRSAIMESQQLIEELMLLANSTAAETMAAASPSCSFLVRNPEPAPAKIRKFADLAARLELGVEPTCAVTFPPALRAISERRPDLTRVLMKARAAPLYKITSRARHHALLHSTLSMPISTHFLRVFCLSCQHVRPCCRTVGGGG